MRSHTQTHTPQTCCGLTQRTLSLSLSLALRPPSPALGLPPEQGPGGRRGQPRAAEAGAASPPGRSGRCEAVPPEPRVRLRREAAARRGARSEGPGPGGPYTRDAPQAALGPCPARRIALQAPARSAGSHHWSGARCSPGRCSGGPPAPAGPRPSSCLRQAVLGAQRCAGPGAGSSRSPHLMPPPRQDPRAFAASAPPATASLARSPAAPGPQRPLLSASPHPRQRRPGHAWASSATA